jgi:PII-like signaling protein
MEKEIRKILYENLGYGNADKAVKELLILFNVSKSLPTIIEIDFDGHLKCQIETTDKAPTILKAVNGYGKPVDCNKDKIRINEI